MRKKVLLLFWNCAALSGLFCPAWADTENWVLSGQSNAMNLLGGKYLESACIPQMNAQGISVHLTGTGQGGTGIKAWAPGGFLWEPLEWQLESPEAPIDVFIWYQGEQDAITGMGSDEYLDSLQSLINRVRLVGGNPGMTVVIIQLSNAIGFDTTPWAAIRDAQQRFVAADSNAILMANIGRGDVHLTGPDYTALSTEIGGALLKFRHGRELNWPGPVLDGAVVNGTDGVIAHFAEAISLSGILAADFALADPDSINPCVEVTGSGNTLVSLRFQRPVNLPARLIYGVGNNPSATLKDEASNRASAVQINLTIGTLRDLPSFAPNGSSNLYPVLNDTLPITSFEAFAEDSVIEPFLSTPISVFATRSNGRVDTVTNACGYTPFDLSITNTSRCVVKGYSPGTARIRVSIRTPLGLEADTVNIRVAASTATLDSLRFSLDTLELMTSDSFRIHAIAYYHKNVTFFSRAVDAEAVWISIDTSIVRVDNGLVRTRAVGSAGITAGLDGKSDTCRIKVYLAGTQQTIFTDQVPQGFAGSVGDAPSEYGTLFSTAVDGFVAKVRIYADSDESGDYVVRIWKMAGQSLVAGPFHWDLRAGIAGWRTFSLPNPVAIAAHEDYTVAVSSVGKFPYLNSGFSAPVLNGDLITYVGSGKYTTYIGALPTVTVWSNQNYFRDVVFVPSGSTAAMTDEVAGLEEGIFISPNPFNPTVTLKLINRHRASAAARLLIHDVRGRMVADLSGLIGKDGTVVWDAVDYPSGVYLLKYHSEPVVMTKRIVLQK